MARLVEHRRVDIDADDVDAMASELDGDPAGAAPCVQDARRVEAPDQRGFAMDVDALRGESIEAGLVGSSVEIGVVGRSSHVIDVRHLSSLPGQVDGERLSDRSGDPTGDG